MPELPPRARAICPTCAKHLELTSGRSITAALGCALATFLLLIPANFATLGSLAIFGIQRTTRMIAGVIELWNEHWILLAGSVALLAMVLPLIRFALLSLVLGTIRLGHRPSWLGPAFRWANELDVWSMPDVLLLAAFVAYKRVAVELHVAIGWGGYCFIAAGFLSMLSRASMDHRIVWRAISPDREPPPGGAVLSCVACDLVMPASADGEKCPRCRARLVMRKKDSMARATALNLAAFIFYWPANTYPMSTAMQMGTRVSYRIIDGIRKLFEVGLAPLGVLVFCTSILIPLLKILGIGWCILSVRRCSTRHLVFKTKLYRVVDELGRWSAVDPFIIAVLVPLMRFPPLAATRAAPGASAFNLVVVLTLMASRLFDSRLMWDAAHHRIAQAGTDGRAG
jgi:paraquat-inducible protein A